MKDYPHSILSSAELFNSGNRMVDVALKAFPSDSYIVTLCGKITEGTAMLAKALGKSIVNEYTSPLAQKDRVRDKRFVIMRDYIASFRADDEDASVAEAYQKLWATIEKLGQTLYSYGYADESAALAALFKDYDTPAQTSRLEQLGATSRYQQLVAAENDFKATSVQKAEASVDINLPLVKTARAQIVAFLLPLLSYIDANAQLGLSVYAEVAAKIDEVIGEVVTTARARQTRETNEALKKAAEKDSSVTAS
jgi:hypothetical protein